MIQTVRLPLLRDRHTHPLLYSVLRDAIDLSSAGPWTDLPPTEARVRAVEFILQQALDRPEECVLVHGWDSGRVPLLEGDLDGGLPIAVLERSLHGVYMNASARRWAQRANPGIDARLRDQAQMERNLQPLLAELVRANQRVSSLRDFFGWLEAAHGVGYAEEMLLMHAGQVRLTADAGVMDRTAFWASPTVFDALPEEDRHRVQGVKLFTDGALGRRTAALHQPYRDSDNFGLLLHATDELTQMLVRHAHVSIAVHAIGDLAIDQLLDAVEAASTRPRMVRVEHAQFISLEAARRARRLGVILCMQPNFSWDSVDYQGRLPAGYAERNNPFRMLIDEAGYVPGVDLLLGSDGMPHGWEAALRSSLFPPFASQALTLREFIAGYCGPPGGRCIEVDIRYDRREVTGRVVASSGPAGDS